VVLQIPAKQAAQSQHQISVFVDTPPPRRSVQISQPNCYRRLGCTSRSLWTRCGSIGKESCAHTPAGKSPEIINLMSLPADKMASAADYPNYPSSVPPYQFQQPSPSQNHQPQLHSAQQRPSRKSRTLSFRSDKSHKSTGSGTHKIDLHETPAEKEAKRLHSKADPTLAMQEAEPCE
jgi:hypothetical protein